MSSNRKKGIVSTVICIAVIALVVLVILGIRRTRLKTPLTNSTVAMGTVVDQTVYAQNEDNSKQAVTDINKDINALDRKYLSWRVDGSDVAKLNANGSAKVNSITADCITQCLAVSKDTDGLFDISVGKLSTLWNIGTDDARVPSDSEIQSALSYVNYSDIKVDGNNVTIGKGQVLDLGSVGKGLACDRANTILKKNNITGATISVGGSVLVYGTNPTSNNGTWQVGIRDPFGGENDYALVCTMDGGTCISTSGDYEKVLEVNGKKYHHILSTETGYPAESNVTGVTVIAKSGLISDALSTSCFILGYSQKSLDLLKKYDAEGIFIKKDKTVYATSGVYKQLTVHEDGFTLKEAA